jgi:hypothetical protein
VKVTCRAPLASLVLLLCACRPTATPSDKGVTTYDDSAITRAFENGKSDVEVESEGVVTRVLADDRSGSRHQRFLVRVASGRTLLIVHNIDLASRVSGLTAGDTVRFRGEYEWNEKGGVLHWTHRDPNGRRKAGWIKHNGRTYQ